MNKRDVDRRTFLRGSAAAAAGAGLVALGPWADALAATISTKALSSRQAATLLVMARRIYPHDRLEDRYYVGVVEAIDGKAAADPAKAKMLSDGIARLDRALGKPFKDAAAAQQVAMLKGMASDPLFQEVRGTSVVALYNQPDLWRKFGYEGPSFDKGGYLHRGFNDLAWLPDPPETASPKPE